MTLSSVKFKVPAIPWPLPLVGIAAFVVINTPSLKLVAGDTALVNFAGVGLLMFGAIVRVLQAKVLRFRRFSLYLLGAFFLVGIFIIAPELLFLRDASAAYAYESLRYLYLVAIFALIALTVEERDLRPFLGMQVVWGCLVALLFTAGFLSYSPDLGQHYNTVSLPIILGALTLAGYLLVAKDMGLLKSLAVFLLLSISIVGLLQLHSRSALVFSAIIILTTVLLRGDGLRDRLRSTAIVGLVAAGGYLLISKATEWFGLTFSHLLLLRLEVLSERGGDELRADIYGATINSALDAPFGHGFGAFPEVVGLNYPHNFFLEFLFSGGVFPVVVVVGAFAFVAWRGVLRVKDATAPEHIQILFILAYVFLTFMVSYSLADSYILLATLALAVPILSERSCSKRAQGTSLLKAKLRH